MRVEQLGSDESIFFFDRSLLAAAPSQTSSAGTSVGKLITELSASALLFAPRHFENGHSKCRWVILPH